MDHDMSTTSAGSDGPSGAQAIDMPMEGTGRTTSSRFPRTSREIAALSPAETLMGDRQDAPQPASVGESRKASEAGSMKNMGHGAMDMGQGAKKPEEQPPMKMDHRTMKMDGPPPGGTAPPTPTPGPRKPSGSEREGHSAPPPSAQPAYPPDPPAERATTNSQAGEVPEPCLMHPDVARSEPVRCPSRGRTLMEKVR